VSFISPDHGKAIVIDDQHPSPRELLEAIGVGAVRTRKDEAGEECRRSLIADGVACSAGFLSKGEGKEGLPHASRTADENVAMLVYPASADELLDKARGQRPLAAPVKILKPGLGVA